MGLKERKEREKENRRGMILEAGQKLFIEKGLASTTMDEIARECELAKGTLYLYFRSKEILFMSIVLRGLTLMYDMMAASQEGLSDPVAKLSGVGKAHQRFYEENPDLFMLMSRSTQEFSSRAQDSDPALAGEIASVVEQLHSRNNELWKLTNDIIAEGIGSGVFREDTDPVEISLGLHAISMAVTIMMDHAKRAKDKTGDKLEHDISPDRLRQMMDRNCGRLILTILKDPSRYADFRGQ